MTPRNSARVAFEIRQAIICAFAENKRASGQQWGTQGKGRSQSTSSAVNSSSNSQQYSIKGNISATGEMIYHLPGCGSYQKTQIDEPAGERWFCTEQEAKSAGWRKAGNC